MQRIIMPKTTKELQEFCGTKVFKLKYSAGSSTQALWRKNGMPHYRVPNSRKILYNFIEIDTWLAEGKVAGSDINGAKNG
jgi:hypothetical protein